MAEDLYADRGIVRRFGTLPTALFLGLATGFFASSAGAQAFVPVEVVLDETGVPGLPPVLAFPFGVASAPGGDVYVSSLASDNVFEVTADGMISEIIDVTGAGLGAAMADPSELTVESRVKPALVIVLVRSARLHRNPSRIQVGVGGAVLVDELPAGVTDRYPERQNGNG